MAQWRNGSAAACRAEGLRIRIPSGPHSPVVINTLMSKNRYHDWTTIQKYYDLGHSIRDVVKEFGVALLTVQRARDKGLFLVRPKNASSLRREALKRNHPLKPCDCCGVTVKRKESKYCCQSCHVKHTHDVYIDRWKNGLETGMQDSFEKVSDHVRQYLLEVKGPNCWTCGWSEVNLHTGKVPVQIDHIDGNPLNNTEENLRVICPNCHSLTSTWGSKGGGRPNRRSRYRKKT